MADLTIPRGDKGFDLVFSVKNAAGSIYDLTTYDAVTLKVWKPGVSGTLIVNAACNVSNASLGTCIHTVGADNFDTLAKYKMELQLTKDGVIESTENYDLKIEESP